MEITDVMEVKQGFVLLKQYGGSILKIKMEDGAVIWIEGREEVEEVFNAIESIEGEWNTSPFLNPDGH